MEAYGSKYKWTIKDGVIVVFFVVLAVANISSNIVLNGYGGIGPLIEQTLVLMLSFIGFIEIASFCHWSIFVPDFWACQRKKERQNEIEAYMAEYFREDIKFVQDYNDERIRFILSQMDIATSQLDRIRLDLIRMRCMPLKSLDDARKKIEYYVRNEYPMVISQKETDSTKLCYKEVDYYINFTDPMFMPEYAQEIAALLSFLIQEKADLNEVDRLVIPYDSNFLLGVEVGKRLGKPIVKMRLDKGKIIEAQPWEGQLNFTDKVIIVHDVLVKADQIIHTLSKLPNPRNVLGVYCLISRKEWNGKEKLKQRDVSVEEISCLDDHDIHIIRGKK